MRERTGSEQIIYHRVKIQEYYPKIFKYNLKRNSDSRKASYPQRLEKLIRHIEAVTYDYAAIHADRKQSFQHEWKEFKDAIGGLIQSQPLSERRRRNGKNQH